MSIHRRSFQAAHRALVISLALLAGAPLAHADEAQPPIAAPYHPAQVMVRFRAGATPEQIAQAKAKAGVTSTAIVYHIVPGLQCVQVPMGTADLAILALANDPSVLYAEPDYLVRADVQNTPYGITMVKAPLLWSDLGNTPVSRGSGATVAVLDTGVDTTHPDLPAPILSTSFIDGEAVEDLHTHGTHTSGTVVAVDNTEGVIGVAPSASLMIGKVLSNSGSGATSGVAAGVDWAVLNGANVISMSLGGGGFSQSFADTVVAANAANVTVVASAGNDNSSTPSYPASYPGVISVAAIDSNLARASFSNFGPLISVTAPGVSVQSTVPIITINATWNAVSRSAGVFARTKVANVTGQAIYCGLGETAADFPAAVSGQIAHIRRGNNTFSSKIQLAVDAGAIGVIISNNVANAGPFVGTNNTFTSFPAIAIGTNDGTALQAISGVVTDITFTKTGHGYANFSGTSMSCPHVAGAAALLYATVPGHPAAQIRQALEQTATDLGDPGRDDLFGYGVINVQAARVYLSTLPVACNLADVANIGGTAEAPGNPDSQLTVDDVIVFINLFGDATGCPGAIIGVGPCNRADVTGVGGPPSLPDGELTVDDVIAFFNAFADGC